MITIHQTHNNTAFFGSEYSHCRQAYIEHLLCIPLIYNALFPRRINILCWRERISFNFFVVVVSSDDTETVAAAAAAELQKPCEMITLRPTNSSFDNGEGNSTFLPLSFLKFTLLNCLAWFLQGF